jgi:hypothetical protein
LEVDPENPDAKRIKDILSKTLNNQQRPAKKPAAGAAKSGAKK